jgi:hypothetical protein
MTIATRFTSLRQLYLAAGLILGGNTALHAALCLHFSTPLGPEDLCLYRLLDALADPATTPITAEDVAEDYQLIELLKDWMMAGRCQPNPFRGEEIA